MDCILFKQYLLPQYSGPVGHARFQCNRKSYAYRAQTLPLTSKRSEITQVSAINSNQASVESSRGVQLMHEGSSVDEVVEDGDYEDNVGAESLKLLEWLSVCEQVSRFTSTPMGKALCRQGSIPFGRNQEESEKFLEQTDSAMHIPHSLDFTDIVDVGDILRSATAGTVLNVSELCTVEKTLSSSRRIYDQLQNSLKKLQNKGLTSVVSNDNVLAPVIAILEGSDFCMPLVQALSLSLDISSLSILDTASPVLSAIRTSRKNNMKTLENLLLEIGEKIVSAGGMDSVFVTTRRARQCVAVRASHKHLLPGGIVLDTSNSGATVFMEPKAALELNNNEVELASEEKAEEFVILKRLTQRLTDVAGDVWLLLEKVTCLDLACAKARYASWLCSVKPLFSTRTNLHRKVKQFDDTNHAASTEFSVDIEGLSHPLLLGKAIHKREEGNDASFPVPIDFKVKSNVRVIVVSGPNTGGKTASMKAFGISALMAKAGMFLPAKGKAVLPWFDQTLADIGDSQSLEQNLSTFSGHIKRVCRIMEAVNGASLVLLDEIGSGTDPSEGSALAAAILEHMASHASLTMVTTHFSKLSGFMDPRFEVASVKFDVKTLRPKYEMLWGVAGQSNALDIASSLGVAGHILTRAKHWMTMLAPENAEQRATQLMKPLTDQRTTLSSQVEAAALILSDAKKLHDELAVEADSLQARMIALRFQREDKMKKELAMAKSSMDEIVSNYERSLRNPEKNETPVSMGDALNAIASVLDTYTKTFYIPEKANTQLDTINRPSIGDSVLIKRLGKTPATVIEAPTEDDETFLVQLGNLKLRARLSEVAGVMKQEKNEQKIMQNAKRSRESESSEEVQRGIAIQTSRNSVDLRGMRVDEALMHLDFAFLRHRRSSVFFVIHGEGTGALRAAVLQRLKGHPLVLKFEQESPMNYGCTAVYLKR
ncbi:hypothetical protein KP509_34G068900 [Ceratopteris richardii]|uniref:Smr domain-containing protein n=1 Tax=Ceratopteris richardii TaxID=49495 RepID=A0A8T2QLD8_CERRI|nr:hypothetical protein KP509_34G068900 [Ceratopteris richardii]